MSLCAYSSNADCLTIERARTLTAFGLTDRQARFLITVMLHSGVFVRRQYATFAGITHGQRVHDFIEKLLARRLLTPIELGSTGRMRFFHVHHKPLPKGGRIRYVPMTRRLTDALREARHLRGPRVLGDGTGKPLTQKVIQVLVRRTARRANVKPEIQEERRPAMYQGPRPLGELRIRLGG